MAFFVKMHIAFSYFAFYLMYIHLHILYSRILQQRQYRSKDLGCNSIFVIGLELK